MKVEFTVVVPGVRVTNALAERVYEYFEDDVLFYSQDGDGFLYFKREGTDSKEILDQALKEVKELGFTVSEIINIDSDVY